ncbi:MAG: hypothetical protein JNJ61_19635 [Anaerolineae bacterium]|nr:hypothetical protein [Anaerolineae bacterium]
MTSRRACLLAVMVIILILAPQTLTAQPSLPTFWHRAPGHPAEPFPNPPEWDFPPGFLAYNTTDYNVFTLNLHRRPVTIAFEKTLPLTMRQQREIAAFALTLWDHDWHLFGGFPWNSFTLLYKNEPINWHGGEPGVGWEEDLAEVSVYQQWIAHGMFHAWWGSCAAPHPSDVDGRASSAKWSSEGMTEYDASRHAGYSIFQQWMQDHWRKYQATIGTQYDVPLTETSLYWQETGDDTYHYNLYNKGSLVAYMIDGVLVRRGLNLNHLFRYMYDRHCLTREPYTVGDVQRSLEAISRMDWSDFFDRYIYGTEPLPLDGSFRFYWHS